MVSLLIRDASLPKDSPSGYQPLLLWYDGEVTDLKGNTIARAVEIPDHGRSVARGHWITEEEAIQMGDILKQDTCSVCGACDWDCIESKDFNFCPNCGAVMRPGKEETDGTV